jgi:predicted porin
VGANLARGVTLSAAYSQAQSNTENGDANSNNNTSQLTATMLYRVRKTYFQAGYARLVQGFSASGTPPSMLGSLYFGLTRWFSFF